MNNVLRYSTTGFGIVGIKETKNGPYVLYQDYCILECHNIFIERDLAQMTLQRDKLRDLLQQSYSQSMEPAEVAPMGYSEASYPSPKLVALWEWQRQTKNALDECSSPVGETSNSYRDLLKIKEHALKLANAIVDMSDKIK